MKRVEVYLMWLGIMLELLPALPGVITDVEKAVQEVKANGWTAQDVKDAQAALSDIGNILGAVLTKL